MSMDKSLKIKGALERHRNVLSRAERIAALELEERWSEGDPVVGLPKVGHRKSHSGRKDDEDKEATEETEGAETAETPPSPPANNQQDNRCNAAPPTHPTLPNRYGSQYSFGQKP